MKIAALAPTRSRKQNQTTSATRWTPEEDGLLRKLISESESISWCAIAEFFPMKTAPQIAGRWDKVLNPRLVKGCWTRVEDEAIIEFVEKHGDKDWANLALLLDGRTGKQCRERYRNHLSTSVNRAAWTADEDMRLAQLHERYGNAWTKLASFFEGRTDNCIKNRWNSTVKKRLERMQKGQPLVMKRGRKPKSVLPLVPEITSHCSSPIEPNMAPPRLEAFPMHPSLRAKVSERRGSESLEQSRMDLQRLLTDLSS
jgi:hypothetical protein